MHFNDHCTSATAEGAANPKKNSSFTFSSLSLDS